MTRPPLASKQPRATRSQRTTDLAAVAPLEIGRSPLKLLAHAAFFAQALSDGTRHNSPLMREPPSPFGKQPASPFGGGDRSPVGSDLSSLGSPGFSNTSQTAMDPWSPPQKNFAADYHRPVQDSYSESKRGGFDPDAFRRANAKFDNSPDASRPDLDRSNLGGNYGGGGGNNNYGGGGGNNNYGGGFNGNAQNQWNQNQGGYQRSPDIFSAEAPLPSYGSRGPSERDIYSQSPDRAPTSPFDPKKGSKIGADDDLLMDDILGELDDI